VPDTILPVRRRDMPLLNVPELTRAKETHRVESQNPRAGQQRIGKIFPLPWRGEGRNSAGILPDIAAVRVSTLRWVRARARENAE